jgi:hypothetical protein
MQSLLLSLFEITDKPWREQCLQLGKNLNLKRVVLLEFFGPLAQNPGVHVTQGNTAS